MEIMNVMIILIILCASFFSPAIAQEESPQTVRLSLKDALQSVDTINLQVLMANARLQQAIAQISQAQADLMPHLEGIVSGNRQTVDLRSEGILFPSFGPHVGPFNTFGARAQVTMALFDPAAFERLQAAKKGEGLSQAELEKTREDILALVADLFVDAERKEQTVGFFKTLLDKDLMSYQVSEFGYNEGTETLLSSNQSKSVLDQTKYLYGQARQVAQDAFLDLKAALHLPVTTNLVLIEDQDFMNALENHAVINPDKETNADMRLAYSQLEARKADQKTAYADLLPTVSGTADYGRSGASPTHASNTYFVGLQANIPFWDGGGSLAKLSQVSNQIKEAQENISDVTQQEEVNVAKARVAILEAEDLKQARFQKLQTTQRALGIALHAQEIGTGTKLELMLAKADFAAAEDEYNEAQATWVMAHIDLLHAQGRLRELVKREE